MNVPPICQLVDDGIIVIVAGADTVASPRLVFCLLSYMETYKHLRDEVDTF